MSLTMKDFKVMIRRSAVAAGLGARSGAMATVRNVYGRALVDSMARYADRPLTALGIEEYRRVESWILGGCKGELCPVHVVAQVAGGSARRALPLFESSHPWKSKATGGPAPVQKRRKLLADAAETVTLNDPVARFEKTRLTNTTLYLRGQLLSYLAHPGLPADIKANIEESLLACQDELRALVNS